MTRRPPESPRDDEQRDFEARWRHWAARPPELGPRAAARRVLEQLEGAERPRRSWGWLGRRPRVPMLASAAALVAVVVVAVGLWLGAPGLAPTAPDPELETPTVGPGVVLMWLDAETPLYMTFAPPDPEGGAEEGEES